MFTADFWRAIGERAIKTLAQSLVAALVASGTGIIDTDWKGALSVAGMATLLSVLTNVGAASLNGGDPSVGTAETLTSSATRLSKGEGGYADGLYVLLVVLVVLVILFLLGFLR